MCPSSEIINQTKNGLFTYCNQTKLFQFVYNNLCFELYEWELQKFIEYISGLDVDYWEKQLAHSFHNRKIPVTVGHNHFIILLNKQELVELKRLLLDKQENKLLSFKEIANNLTFN